MRRESLSNTQPYCTSLASSILVQSHYSEFVVIAPRVPIILPKCVMPLYIASFRTGVNLCLSHSFIVRNKRHGFTTVQL